MTPSYYRVVPAVLDTSLGLRCVVDDYYYINQLIQPLTADAATYPGLPGKIQELKPDS